MTERQTSRLPSTARQEVGAGVRPSMADGGRRRIAGEAVPHLPPPLLHSPVSWPTMLAVRARRWPLMSAPPLVTSAVGVPGKPEPCRNT